METMTEPIRARMQKKTAEISRRGRILTAIERCCTARNYEPVSTSEIMEFSHALRLYRGTSGRDKDNHARAIRRSAQRLCDKVGHSNSWSTMVMAPTRKRRRLMRES